MRDPDATSYMRTLIREKAADPFAFETFMGAWNEHFGGLAKSAEFLDDEADAALDTIASDAATDVVGPKLRRMINHFPNAALVIREDGMVLAQNLVAVDTLGVDPGDEVDELPISLLGGSLISDVIKNSFARRSDSENTQFLRAIKDGTERSLTIAVLPTYAELGRASTALIFVVDRSWQSGLDALLAKAFGLTTAETEILIAFMEGDDLPGIAAARDKSLSTVRTQFHMIMSKAGVSTQADLMRNALILSQFHTEIKEVAEVAKHPHRKSVNLVRPGGRSVDVVLAGKLDGDLVTFIPDATLFTFTAAIEAAFFRAGLCVASVARPGYGGTDPTKDADYEAAMAADIVALQDQLGVEKSVLLAHSTSTGYAYRIGGLIPDRLHHIVLLSTLIPLPYFLEHGIKSPWPRALLQSSVVSPKLLRLMAAAGIKAWKVLGSRRFATIQLRQNPDDVVLATKPDQILEQDAAIRACSAQGMEYAAIDLEVATRDWSDWARDCKTQVYLFHGTKNPVAPIDGIRAFAGDFADKVTLIEIPDGGFMVAVSNASELEQLLKPDFGND